MPAEPSISPPAAGITPLIRPELRTALIYIFVASLWVAYSDMALDRLVPERKRSVVMQTVKGLNFVFTTGVLLFVVLRRSHNRWRKAEGERRALEERFVLAARAATDAIWDWDLATGRLWWSESFCRMFGYSPADLEPGIESWSTRLHPDDLERTEAGIHRVIDGDRTAWWDEYRLRRKDGSYAFVHDRGFVVRDAAGKATRMVGGITDVTHRKEAEDKLERSRRQLRALSARLQSLREEERARISREMHDELGQLLTGLKMDLRWIENRISETNDRALNPVLDKIVEAGTLADSTIATVQRLASELRPGSLDNLGLAVAIRQEADRFQERSGIACQVVCPADWPELPGEVATAAFRIFQEALTNVARHAQATSVRAECFIEQGQLRLRVSDDGKGMPPEAMDDPKSLGLLGMTERSELLGGKVTFQRGPERGTVVEVRIPLGASAPAAARWES